MRVMRAGAAALLMVGRLRFFYFALAAAKERDVLGQLRRHEGGGSWDIVGRR